MGDWQQLGQAVIVGLIFSYLVAKLISIVISFREDHLKVVREKDLAGDTSEADQSSEEVNKKHDEFQSSSASYDRSKVRDDDSGGLVTEESLLGEDYDDWEGIETTELDEMFSAATAFVAATAADRNSAKVSSDIQLQLYGLYKVATEGPCTVPQPSAIKVTARAKCAFWRFVAQNWTIFGLDRLTVGSAYVQRQNVDGAAIKPTWSRGPAMAIGLFCAWTRLKIPMGRNAWQKLGAMPPEEAMQKYIEIVEELFPSWSSTSTTKNKDEDVPPSTSATKGTVGPVFSSLVLEEGSESDISLDAIHVSAREGEVDDLLKNIENDVSVNMRDSEGRTPLHWAVDRGHLKIVEILLNKSADVNAKDNEGQSPLHYAALCEREAFAELLVKHGADPDLKDGDGNSPSDLCSSPWNCLTRTNF